MKPALEELNSISALLSAFNHRNKNQHRITKWWKSFCVLRRNLDKLVIEFQKWETESKLVGETKWTIASREAVEWRAEFMLERVIPKCYVAFSSVVADLQFANLGLMLMGTLARIRTVILPLRSERSEEIVAKVGGAGGDEMTPLPTKDDYDFGEVVKREDVAIPSSSTNFGNKVRNTDNKPEDRGMKKRKERKEALSSSGKSRKMYLPRVEKTSARSVKK